MKKYIILILFFVPYTQQIYTQNLEDIQSLMTNNRDSALLLINKLEKTCQDTCTDSYKIYALKGEIYETINKDSSLFYYSKSIEINPKQPSVVFKKASIFYDKEHYIKFLKELNKGFKIKGTFNNPNEFDQGFYINAKYAAEFLNNIDSALYLMRAVEPTNPDFLKLQFRLHIAKGECKEAKEAFEKYTRLRNQPLNDKILLADIYFVCFNNQKEAMDILYDLYYRDSTNIEVLKEIGDLSFFMSQPDSSLKYFNKILKLEPHNPKSYTNIIDVMYKQGNIKEAKNLLKDAFKIIGYKAILCDYMADFQVLDNNLDSAIYYMNKCITLRETGDFFWKRGSIYAKMDKLDLAYKDYQSALELTPCNCTVLDNCINYVFNAHKYPEVIPYIKQVTDCGCRERVNDNQSHALKIVYTYFYLGEYDKLNEIIDKVLKFYTKDYGLHYIKTLMLAVDDNTLNQAFIKCEDILNKLDNEISLNEENKQTKYNFEILKALIYLSNDDLKNFYKTMDYVIELYGKEAISSIAKSTSIMGLTQQKVNSKIILIQEGNAEISIFVNTSQKTRQKIKKKYGF